MYQIDPLVEYAKEHQAEIDGVWVAARPGRCILIHNFWSRLDDAWEVLTGRADAVKWHKQ